jgi:hypothetical protein
VEMTIGPGAADATQVAGFIEHHAGVWGARRDVASRVEFAVQQTCWDPVWRPVRSGWKSATTSSSSTSS